MPISEKRLAANRANAKLSRGPTSVAGKRISSRNGAKKSDLSKFILIEGESAARFDALHRSFELEFQPATPSDRALVEKLAVYQWLLLRALTLESSAISHEMRRRSEFSRSGGQYHRTLEALHRIKQSKEQKIVTPADTQHIENKDSAL